MKYPMLVLREVGAAGSRCGGIDEHDGGGRRMGRRWKKRDRYTVQLYCTRAHNPSGVSSHRCTGTVDRVKLGF